MRRFVKRYWGSLGTGLLVLAVAGCVPAPGYVNQAEPSASSLPAPVTSTESAPAASGETSTERMADESLRGVSAAKGRPSSEAPAARAAEDLATRLGVGEADIMIMSIREIEIPVTDFGCPGGPKVSEAATADGTTRGEEIVLSIGGREYAYRALGPQVVLCQPPAPFADLPLPPELGQAAESVHEARRDLSRQLGVGLDTVELLAVEAVQWPDSSLGCPTPGMMYAQVITPGYRILLQAGDRTFEYHGDGNQALPCPP